MKRPQVNQSEISNKLAPRTAEAVIRNLASNANSTEGSQERCQSESLYQPKFRVENRRARPVIIKNFVGEGSKFFS